MLSISLLPFIRVAAKVFGALMGLAAAVTAFWAARLWLEASKVAIEPTAPAVEVSYEDAPALGILEAIVAVNATKDAYNSSAALNAKAARWTAVAAIFTGVAVLLSTL